MNRKKKVKQTLKAQIKKKNAKMHKSNKPKYISKAERAKLAAAETENSTPENQSNTAESNPEQNTE
ncbi:DUF2986 domain-containing protein [Thalassotalea crassostreae]|uniref:DUF2986 domain-containing protein n=1 Tax=Thalassotalea crassostreae TaxID=1763536 RepID=UPI000838B480|nr:DUF2986 domain-containing protein [Thalassotalea crassostreae]